MNPENLNSLAVSSDGFAFDSRTGNTYSINAVGLLVIDALKEGAAESQIAGRITERFEVDPETAQRDLQLFLGQLERNRLIEAEMLA